MPTQPRMRHVERIIVAFVPLVLSAGCASIPQNQRAEIRNEIVRSGDETRSLFVREIPGLEQDLAASAGYFTARVSGGKVPIVGGASGEGVLVDNGSRTHTFMDATRVDVGVGLGGGVDRVLVVIETREALEQFRRGIRKFGIGAEADVGETGGSVHSLSGDGYRFYISSETGAAMTATARLMSFSVNNDLTDTGVSDVSVPSTGFMADKEGDDAPRVWNYKLPFLAQKVVDQGYDLPVPYGASLIYTFNKQEQLLTGLEVGINGRDKAPFQFVSFDKSITRTHNVNAKIDAWLFPFLNVYATYGVLDADADIDILIDGNQMLEHLGISCDGILQPRLCDRLQNQNFLLPIHTTPSGSTWGIGGVLAGGWHGWFVTIPFNYSGIDLGRTLTAGDPIVTVTPRFGRNFGLGDWGNFAIFAGGNYLESKLEVSGTYRVPVEDQELTFDYTVQQKNKDPWNLVIGFNWDINKQFSWNLEYDGFIGSREAVIAAVTWRF